jgi:hypothetical protein
MSLQSDFRALITADSSLNTALSNRIYFEVIEDNYDITKTWCVYSFRKLEQQDCLNNEKNFYETYTLYLRLISPDTVFINSLADYIKNYLNGKEQGQIKDIWGLGITPSMDLDKNQHSLLLEFGLFYV